MTTERGIISGLSISHADATIDQLEAATEETQRDVVARLIEVDDVREAFVLLTCNRVEAYVVTADVESGRDALETVSDNVPADIVTELGHEESLRHLLRVAAGLESLVVGEDQILGQVRDAYEDARRAGGVGPVLDAGVTKAIRVGERARTETAINEGVVSIASAAVKLVEEKHGLADSRAIVVGVGEMGTIAAKHLAGRVEELVLANRTVETARSFAKSIDSVETTVRVTDLDGLVDTIASRDVVISATGGSEPVLDPGDCDRLGETFVVDITRPRDIPPEAETRPHLTVYDLDTLEAVTRKTRSKRREAAKRVEEIVDEEFERLLSQFKRKRADAVVSAMYESAERIKREELERTFGTLDLDGDEQDAVEAMADSIVSQLLAPPTTSLRDAAEHDDWSTIHTALRLFDPNLEKGGDPDDISGIDLEDIPEDVRERLADVGIDDGSGK